MFCLIFIYYSLSGGEGWLGFPDLWSGQNPWWNWYLTPVVNFGEVRRAQLAKSTLLTSTLVTLGSFQIFKASSDAKESGLQNATGSYRTYSSLVKMQPRFLSLQWKTCLWAELQRWCLNFAVKDLPLGRTHDDDDDDDDGDDDVGLFCF